MLKTDFGPRLWQQALAASTLTATTPADRGWLIKSIGITAPSATDNWIMTVAGKPIMVFRVRATGTQNILRADDQTTIFHSDYFNFCRRFLGLDPSIPIPLGQTLSLTSVGGATANLFIEFEEHDNSDLGVQNLNHYLGSDWLIPIYTFINASVTAAGTISDDTQVAPVWLPNFLIGTLMTDAWSIDILAAFFQGTGVNTFSGAANHQSTTVRKHIVKDGVDLFSHPPTPAGIPNNGVASAAGSANTAFGQVLSPYASFERTADLFDNVFDTPIAIRNGDTVNVREEIAGDVTGGASYEPELGIWICRVKGYPG